MAAGACCLTLLSFFVTSDVEKKCREQHEVFRKLKVSKLPNVPLQVLRNESIDEIKNIIYRDSYDHAQSWLTDEEKKILNADSSDKLYFSTQRFFLKDVIENGFSLEPYSFYFLFPDRLDEQIKRDLSDYEKNRHSYKEE